MRFFLRSSRRQLQQVQFSFRFLLLFAFCVSFAAGAAFGKMERTSAIAGWRLLFAPQVPLRVHIRIYEHTAIVYGHAIRRLLNYKRISLYEAYGTLLDATSTFSPLPFWLRVQPSSVHASSTNRPPRSYYIRIYEDTRGSFATTA